MQGDLTSVYPPLKEEREREGSDGRRGEKAREFRGWALDLSSDEVS